MPKYILFFYSLECHFHLSLSSLFSLPWISSSAHSLSSILPSLSSHSLLILRVSSYIFGIIMRKPKAKFLGIELVFSDNWFFFSFLIFLKPFFLVFLLWVLNKGVVLPCLWCALHNACLIEVGYTWVCFLCYFLWLYFAIFRPIYCFAIEKWECTWGSVWMRNMFMVFVFYQGKKNCSLFCHVCVLCYVVLLLVWVVYFWFLFVHFFYCVNMLLGSLANLLINLKFLWGILASFVALKTSEQLISSEIFWSCLYLMLIRLL